MFGIQARCPENARFNVTDIGFDELHFGVIQPVRLCGQGVDLDARDDLETSFLESLCHATSARKEVDRGRRRCIGVHGVKRIELRGQPSGPNMRKASFEGDIQIAWMRRILRPVLASSTPSS